MPVTNARRKYHRCTCQNTAGLHPSVLRVLFLGDHDMSHPAQIWLHNNPAGAVREWRKNLPLR